VQEFREVDLLKISKLIGMENYTSWNDLV